MTRDKWKNHFRNHAQLQRMTEDLTTHSL
jgi:hypothetical protein